MKKIFAYVLAAVLSLSVWNGVTALNITDSDFALYTFENGDGGAVYENGRGRVGVGAYGNGLFIVAEKEPVSVHLPFDGEAFGRYRITVWVLAEDTVSFTLCGAEVSIEKTIPGEGDWVQYEGTATLSETATQIPYFSVTANGSFSLDDCMIVSEKRQAIAYGNMVKNGTMDQDFSDWKTPNIHTEAIPGANGSKQAMSVQVLADWGCARADVRVDFGRTYKLSWYAKAVSEDAVGLDMKYILDRVPYRQDTNTPMYFEKPVGKLTAEWQRFEVVHKELNLTTDQCIAELYFRAGSGRDKVTFAFDEVVLEEVDDSYEVDSYVVAEGNRHTQEAVTAVFYRQGLAEGVYYRFMQSFGEGYAVMESGYTTEDKKTHLFAENFTGKCCIAVNAKDINGVVGKTVMTSWNIAESAYETDIITNICQEIWTPETETLTAETLCRSTEDQMLSAYLAVYDETGRLTDLSVQTFPHVSGTDAICTGSTENGQTAKLMLFDADTLKPIKAVDEITKTTSGHFIYVDSETGRDFGAGTKESPLKTLSGAKVKVRSCLSEATEDIYVVFAPGEYKQTSTVSLTENDTSDNVYVHYVSEEKGKAVFTGGMDVEGFARWSPEKNIYRAYVGTEVRSRQMFVDGIRATRARSNDGLENAVNLGENGVGYTTTDASLLSYRHIEDLEFCFFEDWTHSYVGVKAVTDNGDGTVTVAMREKDWENQWTLKGNCYPSVPEYMENALELLDEEGEWYLDTHEGYVYYKPRVFEDMQKVRVVLPVGEQMLKIKGESAHNVARNLTFRGITFENTTWNVPSEPGGFCCGQNNKHFGGEERFIPGAVHAENVHNIAFIGCKFMRLGMTGLKMCGGLKNLNIVGNEFYDISGGALVVGDVFSSGENPNPENPSDPAYIVENVNITDNYMHKISVDYKGGAGVSTSFPVNSNLSYNEVYDTSYSGFHLGWGWNTYQKTVTQDFNVKGNYIHKVLNTDLFDGGGVYFLGRTNGSPEHPNRFEENYLYDICNAFGAIYPDNGSTNWDILSNVCDMSKTPVWHRNFEEGEEGYIYHALWLIIHMSSITDIYLDNNYTTTANEMNNGTINVVNQNVHVHPDGDWPEEAREIIERSGPRDTFSDNFRNRLQEVDTTENILLKKGEQTDVKVQIQTEKEKLYHSGNYEIYYSTCNPEIAVFENGTVTAVGAGETEVILYVKENEVLKTKKIHVTVS